MGRAVDQAVRRWSRVAEARVRSQPNPCEICGGQNGITKGFHSITPLSSASVIPTMLRRQ